MSAPVKLAAFALALAASFGVGLGAGALAGPFDDVPAAPPMTHEELNP